LRGKETIAFLQNVPAFFVKIEETLRTEVVF